MTDVPPTQGVGVVVGMPDEQTFADGTTIRWLPHERNLKCDVCGATWVGADGDPCTWCADALNRQAKWQAELLLQPPDIDPDDRNHDNVMLAWAQRLKRGVEAELVTQMQASNAWERTVRRGVAA